MPKTLYASIPGVTNILSINVSASHTAATASAIIVCKSTTKSLGDAIAVDLGFTGNHSVVFTGFVKQVEIEAKSGTVTLTCQDTLIRAVDFFLVSSSPDTPFSRQNIQAEDLVRDLLLEAGLTSYTSDVSNFTFAVSVPAEINLTSVYQYCRFISDLIAWHIWADNAGTIHFEDRKPYKMPGDSSVATINQGKILAITNLLSDRDIRNKIVVYGANSITSTRQAASPYLPPGFFKAVVLSTFIIDTQTSADLAAEYNLELLNRPTKELSISIKGNPGYEARQIVTVNEAITGTSGDWYVYSIEHVWSKSGYIVNMELTQ